MNDELKEALLALGINTKYLDKSVLFLKKRIDEIVTKKAEAFKMNIVEEAMTKRCEMCNNNKMNGHDVCSKECGRKLITSHLNSQKHYQQRADTYGRLAAKAKELYGE